MLPSSSGQFEGRKQQMYLTMIATCSGSRAGEQNVSAQSGARLGVASQSSKITIQTTENQPTPKE